MPFRPLHDRVLIRRVEAQEKSASGIIIPDAAKEIPMEGEVVAVGPGARGEDGKLQPLDVKAGDRVLFGKWSGTEVKLNGEDFVVMKESDIIGDVANATEAEDDDEAGVSATLADMDAILERLDEGIAAEHVAMDLLLRRMFTRAP